MAYDKNGLKIKATLVGGQTNNFYYTSTDALATIDASGYFSPDASDKSDLANLISVNDFIQVDASDGGDIYWVSAVSPITLVSVEGSSPGALLLAQGNILVGNGSGYAAAFDSTGNAQLLLGNGTTMVSVAMSGDVNITNAGVTTIANNAVSNAKLANGAVAAGAKMNLTRGSIYRGDASGNAEEHDAKTAGQILVGDGSDVVSVAMSGDATLASSGALTIANGAITAGPKISLNQGEIIIGDVSNQGSAFDVSTSGQLIIGNGTTATSVAMSGDATIDSAGLLTIANGAVENSMLGDGAVAAGAKIALAEGNVFIGNALGQGSLLDGSASGAFFVGNGTTMTAVTMSGDATMDSAGVVTIASGAVDVTELTVTQGNIIVGDAGNAGSLLDASTDGQLLIGNGTTLASVAMSGDATIANTGAITIAASAVENSMLAAGAVTAGAKLALTEGHVWLGDATNNGAELDCSTAGQMLLGNGTTLVSVAMSGDATIDGSGALTIAATSVENSMLAADAVTVSKLDNASIPYYPVLAGTVTWSGGGASYAPTVSGALATDILQATIRVAPTEAGYLASAIPSADTITFTLSAANTSNDAQIDYVLMRAVS